MDDRMIATIFYRYLKGKSYTKLANHFLTIIKKDKIKLFRKDKRDVPTMKELLESYNKENKSKGKRRIYESSDESDNELRVTKKRRKKYTISSDSVSDSVSDSDSDSNESSSFRRQSSLRDKSSVSVNKEDDPKEKSKELNKSTNKVTEKQFKSKEVISSSDSSDSDWKDSHDNSSDSSDSDNDDNQSVKSFSSSSSIQVIEPSENLAQKNPQEKSNVESNKAIEENNKNDAEKINEKDKTSEDKKTDEENGDEVEIVEKQIEKEKNEQEKDDNEKELFCSTGFLSFPDIKDTKFDYAADVKILINYNTGTKRLVIIDSDLKAVHLDKCISKNIKLTKERNFDTHVRIKLDKNQVEPKGHTLLLKFQFAEQTNKLLKVFKEAKKDEDFLMVYEKQPKSKESIEKAKLLQLPINFFD